MKSTMNENIKNFRQEIAALEKEQRSAKDQRKTVNFHGERTMEPYEAYCTVQNNKFKLRCMYAAYGLMRGRKFAQIESKWDKDEYPTRHPLVSCAATINKYLEKYGYTMKYEEKKSYWGTTYKSFEANCDEEIICVSEQTA